MNTKAQQERMIYDFLRLQAGGTFDGIKAANLMREAWGVDIDWHEITYTLDWMTRVGKAQRVDDNNGHSNYYIL